MGMIRTGDALGLIRRLPPSSVDAVITDPAYGLQYMGKDWDKTLPNPRIWREMRRVLKPGGHLCAFGHPRLYHRLAVDIEDAGFEIRDALQWQYNTGFPKNHAQGDGWGTALRPEYEPITLARKPMQGRTLKANRALYGTGAINVDALRRGNDGRYPSHVIVCPKPSTREREIGLEWRGRRNVNDGRKTSIDNAYQRGDTLRTNVHPTVKPIALMRDLVRLVTPAEGIALDPYAGSGTTGIACMLESRSFVGFEINEEYAEIAEARIHHALTNPQDFGGGPSTGPQLQIPGA